MQVKNSVKWKEEEKRTLSNKYILTCILHERNFDFFPLQVTKSVSSVDDVFINI